MCDFKPQLAGMYENRRYDETTLPLGRVHTQNSQDDDVTTPATLQTQATAHLHEGERATPP